MQFSKRIKRIAALCAGARLLADVGCDHGYTALCALKDGFAETVLCMDVNEGPLGAAVRNLREAGEAERAGFLLSDGLRALALSEEELKEGERSRIRRFFEGCAADPRPKACSSGQMPALSPDVLVLSGIGGVLLCDILCLLPTNGDSAVDAEGLFLKARAFLGFVRRLVLSPQSEPERVRRLLPRLGFQILHEEMLFEDGKYYLLLTAAHPGDEETSGDYAHAAPALSEKRASEEPLSLKALSDRLSAEPSDELPAGLSEDAALRYGSLLFSRRDPVFCAYLKEQEAQLLSVLEKLGESGGSSPGRRERLAELKARLSEVRLFLSGWDAH